MFIRLYLSTVFYRSAKAFKTVSSTLFHNSEEAANIKGVRFVTLIAS